MRRPVIEMLAGGLSVGEIENVGALSKTAVSHWAEWEGYDRRNTREPRFFPQPSMCLH
jgi:hypothetical protein